MTPTDIENAHAAIRAVRNSATGRGILGPAALQCAGWLERALAERAELARRVQAAASEHPLVELDTGAPLVRVHDVLDVLKGEL